MEFEEAKSFVDIVTEKQRKYKISLKVGKSTLCNADPYLMELSRYHLYPVPAALC